MTPAAPVDITAHLIEAGAAGLIILVVVMFLRFLATERADQRIEHKQMLDFIAQQRIENNLATTNLSGALASSLMAVAEEIKLLRIMTNEHNQMTEDAIEEMRAKTRLRRAENGKK
jgi:Zn-dependent membrane protease YugP